MRQVVYRDLIPYGPPNATDADRQEVDRLINMRKLTLNKQERLKHIADQTAVPDTLEVLVEGHDPERKRFVKGAKSALHNEEYLVSTYMDYISRPDAVPDSWRTPTPHRPNVTCKIRKKKLAPAPRPARVEGETLDTSRYALRHRGGCNCQASLHSQRCTCCARCLWLRRQRQQQSAWLAWTSRFGNTTTPVQRRRGKHTCVYTCGVSGSKAAARATAALSLSSEAMM